MNNIHPVIGIDVAKDFCYYCILDPAGNIYRQPFKLTNQPSDFEYMEEEIKKVEKEFGANPVMVLESTAHYSNTLVHFFAKKAVKIYLVNPLLSHSIRNSHIRKVKNDKVDAYDLARLYFLKDLRPYEIAEDNLENLRILSRAYLNISDQRITLINQLTANVEQAIPNFTKVFTDISSKTALNILTQYQSAEAILNAPKQEIVQLIASSSKRSVEYGNKKYDKLCKACKDAFTNGIFLESYYNLTKVFANMLVNINKELASLFDSIKELSSHIPAVSLLMSIPGIGEKIAPIVAAEIGNINRFDNAKQLVAYCGIDPSVRQSGNFVGSKNKLTKRGSVYIRRALYLAATVSIRKDKSGKCVNPVMHEYYQKKIQTKTGKQALGAIMNKLVRIIYSVLKNEKEFVLITPEEQQKMYRSKINVSAA